VPPKRDFSDLLERAKERATSRRSADEARVHGTHEAIDPELGGPLWKSKLAEMQAVRAVSIPDRQPLPTDFLYYVARDSAGGRLLEIASGDELWPEIVRRLQVRETISDIDGKYSFSDVTGGIYYVYALFSTDHATAEWLHTVVIQSAENQSVNLYNATAVVIANKSD
jgi:hypothetical protein